MRPAYLVDTNVLLRASHPGKRQHVLCKQAIDTLDSRNAAMHFTLENAAEFWNSTIDAKRLWPLACRSFSAWQAIERSMTLLPDNENVYKAWRGLAETHQLRGVQVHGARLAAAMLVHNVPHILPLNTADFARFPGVQAVHPQEV